MGSWKSYLNTFVHVALLFFFVPIRINKPPFEELEDAFRNYLMQFNKSYNPEEYLLRLQCFNKSLSEIEKLNSNPKRSNNSAQYGLTKFSDMEPKEFLHLNGNKNRTERKTNSYLNKRSNTINLNELPRKIDWREKNIVTEVKNQRYWGTSWAYSIIEIIESAYAKKYGKLEEFSIQQIIDCDNNNNTCDSLSWMTNNKIKIQKDKDYPLQSTKKQCQITNEEQVVVQINQHICKNFENFEDIILDLLAKNGPVSALVNADTWQNYVGGIIQYNCSNSIKDLNHAVQIVGYNLDADIPYYIVRNNWGRDFGDDGYLYIAIGHNVCGIAMEVSALTIL